MIDLLFIYKDNLLDYVLGSTGGKNAESTVSSFSDVKLVYGSEVDLWI